jgi:hypothetical protein
LRNIRIAEDEDDDEHETISLNSKLQIPSWRQIGGKRN